MGLSLLYMGLESSFENLEDRLSVMAGFSLGASSIALFARVGGGIYTKAASASLFLSFFGTAFLGLFPFAGIGINSFSPKILATLVVG